MYSLNITIRFKAFHILQQRKHAIFTCSYWVPFGQIMRDHISTFKKSKVLAYLRET